MKKKANFVEPETTRAWGINTSGTLSSFTTPVRPQYHGVLVRIINEKDYQRLLKLAKKGHAVRGK